MIMARFLTLLLLTVLLATSANGQTQTHTDIDSFNNAIPMDALVDILDFDSLNPADIIISGDTTDGFEFVYDFGGVELRVGDSFTTSSPPHYLGTTDADLLQDGDDITLTIAPANAFGIHFITADIMEDDDISLTFNGATASLIALDIQQTLPDGSFVYFLGVTSNSQTDTTAMITTVGGGFFLYNVDEIIRAENPTGILLGDVNLDGVVNLLDVTPFVELLSMGTFQLEADINQDGFVNLLDVSPFVAILSGG